MRLAVTVLVLTSSAVASAGPLEVGAGIGLVQSANDASNGNSSQQVDALFARLRLLGPLAAQVEIGHIDLASGNVRTLEGAAVLQFGKRIRPFVLVGVAADSQTDGYGSTNTYTSVEAGVGVEFRLTANLTIGADLRDGDRMVPVTYATPASGAGITPQIEPRIQPSQLTNGDYRSLRLTLAINL